MYMVLIDFFMLKVNWLLGKNSLTHLSTFSGIRHRHTDASPLCFSRAQCNRFFDYILSSAV